MTLPQVIALGGSLLRPEESENRKIWFGKLRQLAIHIEGNSRKLGIVVGGGLPAREGNELAKDFTSRNSPQCNNNSTNSTRCRV